MYSNVRKICREASEEHMQKSRFLLYDLTPEGVRKQDEF
jgi:hypothetical protein